MTHEEQREKVIDKVRKLMALTQSPNEHEAALAAEKAQALLAEYNLSMQDVEAKVAESEYGPMEVGVTGNQPWIRQVMAAAAKLYFCGYFYSERNVTRTSIRHHHTFVGEKHNVIVAGLMSSYLISTIQRLAMEGSKAVAINERGQYKRSFLLGASLRLRRRIEERIEASKFGGVKTSDGRNLPALMPLYVQAQGQAKSWMDANISLKKAVASRARPTHLQGFEDGRSAADRVSLDSQVGQSKMGRLGRS